MELKNVEKYFKNKMKKIKRITTTQDCIQKLHYICHDFFYADLLMHKQGVVYEIESYQDRTIKRLKLFFQQVKKIIKKRDKGEIIKIPKEREVVFYGRADMVKERCMRMAYSPELITAVAICVAKILLCERIRAMLAEEKFAEKSLKEILEFEIGSIKEMHLTYKKDLYDYGYIPKKEKSCKTFKRK